MTASHLILSLLVLLVLGASVTTHAAAKSLTICSASSCLFRNGTRCDRTRQDCPRCVMHDPLLGSAVCAGLETGSVCLKNFTLCPETPLEASTSSSSDAGFEWQPLNTTTTTTTTPTPPPTAPVRQAVANNVPLISTGLMEPSDKHGFPTWTIAVMVAAVVVVAGVLLLYVRHRKRARSSQRQSTLPVPPPFKDEDLKYECSTNISSPHSFHSLDGLTIHPERAHKALSPPRPREDRSAPSHHHSSELEFSYVRQSSTSSVASGLALFTDSNRSAFYDDDIDVFLTRNGVNGELDLCRSLGVDELVVMRGARPAPSRQTSVDEEDEDVDIYPDTAVTRLSGAGRMFSPKTTRALALTNFTTFSVDDDNDAEVVTSAAGRCTLDVDEYPDTAVVPVLSRPPSTAARRSATPLDQDVVDVWASHRAAASDDTETAEQQQRARVAKWKLKYAAP